MERDRFHQWLLGSGPPSSSSSPASLTSSTNDSSSAPIDKISTGEETEKTETDIVLFEELYSVYQLVENLKPILAEWKPLLLGLLSSKGKD